MRKIDTKKIKLWEREDGTPVVMSNEAVDALFELARKAHDRLKRNELGHKDGIKEMFSVAWTWNEIYKAQYGQILDTIEALNLLDLYAERYGED